MTATAVLGKTDCAVHIMQPTAGRDRPKGELQRLYFLLASLFGGWEIFSENPDMHLQAGSGSVRWRQIFLTMFQCGKGR